MKVNQAKQRLGPRIQAEAESVAEVSCKKKEGKQQQQQQNDK